MKTVSVVVVCKNEERHIERCLRSIANTSYKNKEIIVVDSSTDKTPQIVKKFRNVKLIRDLIGPLGHSRNLGWKAAKGEYVAFVDADMIIPKDFFEKILNYRNDATGIMGCRKLPFRSGWLSNSDSLSLHLSKMQWNILRGQPPSLECGGSVYSKKALQAVGGFKEEKLGAEDPEIAKRIRSAGFKIMYTKEAYCYNDFPWNFKRWAYQLMSGGASGLNWKYIIGFILSFPRGLIMSLQGLLTTAERFTSLTLFIYYPLKWTFLFFGGVIMKISGHKPYSKLSEIEAQENHYQ